MAVTNKCNISKLVLSSLESHQLGIPDTNTPAILENYLKYLNCSTVDVILCYPDNCVNEAIRFRCNFLLFKLSFEVVDNILMFSGNEVDHIGGKAPYTYVWSYSSNVFNVNGPTNKNVLKLTLKAGKKIELTSGYVSLTITDVNGCSSTKNCFIINGQLNCSQSYVPCYAPGSLIVTDKVVICSKPIGLIVN